jgi:hypothetical protein
VKQPVINVRIVKRPFGEAPEEIRDAWIGVLLPVLTDCASPMEAHALGVLSGPRSLFGLWLKQWFPPKEPPVRGYAVDAPTAFGRLETVNPSAAEWWRTNTPYLLNRGRILFFDEECCVVELPASTDNKEL